MQSKILLGIILILLLSQNSVTLYAQDQPYWVKHLTIPEAKNYYYGIGQSVKSPSDADNDALIQFSKSIEVVVKSKTKYIIEEENYKIDDQYNAESEVSANIILKGIAINERYRDISTGVYYSLIMYKKDEYVKLLIANIKRELNLLSEKLKSEEIKAAEKLRHEQEMTKLNEAKERSDMERERREELLKAEKKRLKLNRERMIFQQYQLFYKKPMPSFFIDVSNAEFGFPKNQIILKPTIHPFGFIQANYNHLWRYWGFSFGIYWKNQKLQLQDAHLKLKIFKDNYGIYPIGIAIGLVQYSSNLSNLSNIDTFKGGITPALYTNASLPQLYSHTTLYLDVRKLSFGIQYHPFFDYFGGKLFILIQNDLIFMEEFRNRFKDRFLIQPGIGFEVVPNSLFLLFSYEDNEYIVLTLDYKF